MILVFNRVNIAVTTLTKKAVSLTLISDNQAGYPTVRSICQGTQHMTQKNYDYMYVYMHRIHNGAFRLQKDQCQL